MDANNKKKYTIIALIIVSIMILSPILYVITNAISATHQSKNSNDIRQQVDSERALKIIDIHYNLEKYKNKEVTMNLQFFHMEGSNERFLVGALDNVNGKEEVLFNIVAQTEDKTIPKKLENYDWVKVTGTIGEFKQNHEDHTEILPILHVKSIKKEQNN